MLQITCSDRQVDKWTAEFVKTALASKDTRRRWFFEEYFGWSHADFKEALDITLHVLNEYRIEPLTNLSVLSSIDQRRRLEHVAGRLLRKHATLFHHRWTDSPSRLAWFGPTIDNESHGWRASGIQRWIICARDMVYLNGYRKAWHQQRALTGQTDTTNTAGTCRSAVATDKPSRLVILHYAPRAEKKNQSNASLSTTVQPADMLDRYKEDSVTRSAMFSKAHGKWVDSSRRKKPLSDFQVSTDTNLLQVYSITSLATARVVLRLTGSMSMSCLMKDGRPAFDQMLGFCSRLVRWQESRHTVWWYDPAKRCFRQVKEDLKPNKTVAACPKMIRFNARMTPGDFRFYVVKQSDLLGAVTHLEPVTPVDGATSRPSAAQMSRKSVGNIARSDISLPAVKQGRSNPKRGYFSDSEPRPILQAQRRTVNRTSQHPRSMSNNVSHYRIDLDKHRAKRQKFGVPVHIEGPTQGTHVRNESSDQQVDDDDDGLICGKPIVKEEEDAEEVDRCSLTAEEYLQKYLWS